jgi:para-nitrobenzyl esterase
MKAPYFFIIAASCVLPTTGSPITSTIAISDGVVHGTPRDGNGIASFLGIPYAAPPVGDLRWKSPQPAAKFPSSGISAQAFGNSCWSSDTQVPTFKPQNEDCLTVNVWTGAQQSSANLPVMVWLYGGGFQFGASADPQYNGSNLATKDVIVVSFNYRLSVFGFLALEELDTEGPFSGNYGLQDQIAAMRWVKANIAAFGGDPENVTIFGQSAGAHSVGLLMASPLASGLFNKAILESGAWWDSEHGSIANFTNARGIGERFQEKIGASNVAELRSMSASAINNATLWNPNTDPALTNFAPSIDAYVLTEAPGTTFAEGNQAKVPLLAGWLSDEEFFFLGRSPPHATAAQFQSSLQELFNTGSSKALTLYPDNVPAQLNASADALIGDLIIREQTWEAADKHHGNVGQPVYMYYFTYTSPYSPIAIHTAEIPFVFGNLGPNPIFGGMSAPTPSLADLNFSGILMSYWTNFAKQGNPNAAGLPTWPTYNGATGNTNILLLNNTIEAYGYDLDKFNFIESFRKDGVLPTSWLEVDTDN